MTDGGRQFVASEFEDFLKIWGVQHHFSSAYCPHSNLLAESSVKSMKRIIRDNVGRAGKLDTDAVAKAVLTHRNTPIRGLKLSPAQILFNRHLRDSIPMKPGSYVPRKEWIMTLD